MIGTLVSTIRTGRQFGSRHAFIVWSGALAWLLAACSGKKDDFLIADAPPELQTSGSSIDPSLLDQNIATSGAAASAKIARKPTADEDEPAPNTTGSIDSPQPNSTLVRSSSYVPEFETQTYPIELIDIDYTGARTYPIEYASIPSEPVRLPEPPERVIEIAVLENLEPQVQTPDSITSPENNVPVAAEDTGAMQEDGQEEGSDMPSALNGNLLSNDTDADPDAKLSVIAVSDGGDDGTSITTVGAFGTLVVNKATGDYIYTLHSNEAAVQSLEQDQTVTDAFTYTVSDGQGGTAASALTITITGQNDAPMIELDHEDFDAAETLVAVRDNLTTTGQVTFSDVDTGDTPTASVAERLITLAGVEISPDTRAAIEAAFSITDPSSGEWAFNLAAENVPFLSNGELQAIYTVAIADEAGAVVTQDVTITLTGGQVEPELPQGGWLL